ncbi:MAG: hypothetical protein KDB04_10075 [Acidimicrobiales bacterium]|nr:hypothetical protein [Acidimicrobiales bacterium]
MRLEQLVLFGPFDNFSVQFGPRVTVLAGLTDPEREGMLQTLVEAMAGKVPNASVVFVDQAGRRVFADRMGATYAETGVAAPSLGELLGTDPAVIADLVTLRAEDLGLGDHRDIDEVDAELTSARAAHEQLTAERDEATTFLIEIEGWQRDLDALDAQIDRATDDAARWAWMRLRAQLDDLRADLAALDAAEQESDDETDDRLLDAVEELRSAGEAWAEASTAAEELAARLGPLPPVSDADLARVAATPEALPEDFEDRVAAIADAAMARAERERDLELALAPTEDPGDGIVYSLAPRDQEALWAAYDAAIAAQEAYDAELAAHQAGGHEDPHVEGPIEEAHREVVRCQREVDRRFRPGALGVGALAVTALLAGDAISIFVGVILLAASVGLGWWLLAVPRRALAQAEAAEREALAQTEADSWLGLHLRRIDRVVNHTDRAPLSAALDRRTSALLDWEERSEGVSLAAAGERREAIVRHAAALDVEGRAAAQQQAREAVAAAAAHEAEARRALGRGLESYGLSADGAADLEIDQIRRVLVKRTAAGRVAREALELQHQLATATSAGAILDRLLRQLGFDDGDLAGRLARAVIAVEAARERREAEEGAPRRRDELEAEIAVLAERVDAERRITWDLTPDPTEPPAERDDLLERRRALGLELVSRPRPDVSAIERRLAVSAERVRALETERRELEEGSGSVRRRLADRIARTTWIGPNEEALPIVIDDPFADVDPEELFKLLDMLVRLSSSTQIVLLTTDPTIAKWARREAAEGVVTVLESHGAEVR